MKWYYEWKLNKVRAKIAALEAQTRVKLLDDYTTHSKLRVLNKVAGSLQQRLAKHAGNPVAPMTAVVPPAVMKSEPEEAC